MEFREPNYFIIENMGKDNLKQYHQVCHEKKELLLLICFLTIACQQLRTTEYKLTHGNQD